MALTSVGVSTTTAEAFVSDLVSLHSFLFLDNGAV